MDDDKWAGIIIYTSTQSHWKPENKELQIWFWFLECFDERCRIKMDRWMIDWWLWMNGWIDNGWAMNSWWVESKMDIRVTVFVLVRSQSNASPQVLVSWGPSIVQVWDGAQTARRVRSWKERQLPWRWLHLFSDVAGGREIRYDCCRVPRECGITCEKNCKFLPTWILHCQQVVKHSLGIWLSLAEVCCLRTKLCCIRNKELADGRSEACANTWFKFTLYVHLELREEIHRWLSHFWVLLKLLGYSTKQLF